MCREAAVVMATSGELRCASQLSLLSMLSTPTHVILLSTFERDSRGEGRRARGWRVGGDGSHGSIDCINPAPV